MGVPPGKYSREQQAVVIKGNLAALGVAMLLVLAVILHVQGPAFTAVVIVAALLMVGILAWMLSRLKPKP